MKKGFFLLFTIIITINHLMAVSSYIGRSTEGLLMGDAYTAVADDEMTLFYNPAAMGRHRGVSLTPVKGNFQLPDVTKKDIGLNGFNIGVDNRLSDWPSEPEKVTDRILGHPVFFGASTAPSVKVGSFGMNLFFLNKGSMVLENATAPMLDLNYRYDKGFILGYAFNIGPKRKMSKSSKGHLSSLGISLKSMKREGLDGKFSLFGADLLQILSDAGDYKAIGENLRYSKELRKKFGYSKGQGFGFDLGWEHNYLKKGSLSTFGVSLLDIGDTAFKLTEGTTPVPIQKMSLHFGAAFSQDLGLLDFTLSADFHDALDYESSTISKIHFGGRFRLPFLSIYTGWNGGYGSWGIGTNFMFFKIQAGFYGIETAQAFRQRESKRAIISISLAEVSFDDLNLPF